MWLDKQLMFSEDQAVTGTASAKITSTNVIDVGDAKKGEGNPLEIFCDVNTAIAFNIVTTATSTFRARLLTSAFEGMTGSTTLEDTGALAYTEWDAVGDGPGWRVLPDNAKQYLALRFDIGAGGWITAGKISAGIVLGKQSNI